MYIPPNQEEPTIQSISQEKTRADSAELPSNTGAASKAARVAPEWSAEKQFMAGYLGVAASATVTSVVVPLTLPVVYPVITSLAALGEKMTNPEKREGFSHAIGTLLLAPYRRFSVSNFVTLRDTATAGAHRDIEKLKDLNIDQNKGAKKEITQFFNDLHVTYEKAQKTGKFEDLNEKLGKLQGPIANSPTEVKMNKVFNKLLQYAGNEQIETAIFKREKELGVPKGSLYEKYYDASSEMAIRKKYGKEIGSTGYSSMHDIPYHDQLRLKREVLKEMFSTVVTEDETKGLINDIMDLENRVRFPQDSEEGKWKQIKDDIMLTYTKFYPDELSHKEVQEDAEKAFNKLEEKKDELQEFINETRLNSASTPEEIAEKRKAWNKLCTYLSNGLLEGDVFKEEDTVSQHPNANEIRNGITKLAVTLCSIDRPSSMHQEQITTNDRPSNMYQEQITTKIHEKENELGIPEDTLYKEYANINEWKTLESEYSKEHGGGSVTLYSVPHYDILQLKREVLEKKFSSVVGEEGKTEDVVNSIMDLENKVRFPEGSKEEKWKQTENEIIDVFKKTRPNESLENLKQHAQEYVEELKKRDIVDTLKQHHLNGTKEGTPEERRKAWNDMCVGISGSLAGKNVFEAQHDSDPDADSIRGGITRVMRNLCSMEE